MFDCSIGFRMISELADLLTPAERSRLFTDLSPFERLDLPTTYAIDSAQSRTISPMEPAITISFSRAMSEKPASRAVVPTQRRLRLSAFDPGAAGDYCPAKRRRTLGGRAARHACRISREGTGPAHAVERLTTPKPSASSERCLVAEGWPQPARESPPNSPTLRGCKTTTLASRSGINATPSLRRPAPRLWSPASGGDCPAALVQCPAINAIHTALRQCRSYGLRVVERVGRRCP